MLYNMYKVHQLSISYSENIKEKPKNRQSVHRACTKPLSVVCCRSRFNKQVVMIDASEPDLQEGGKSRGWKVLIIVMIGQASAGLEEG